jgi:hypothetical protein
MSAPLTDLEFANDAGGLDGGVVLGEIDRGNVSRDGGSGGLNK